MAAGSTLLLSFTAFREKSYDVVDLFYLLAKMIDLSLLVVV